MPSKIEETFCINVGEDSWCAVLGNHYPNLLRTVTEEDQSALVEAGIYAAEDRTWCTQRLCDQTNVQYKYVMLRAPTCPECLRIKGLMVEFARTPEQESTDDDEPEGRGDAGGAVELQGDEPEAAGTAEVPSVASDDSQLNGGAAEVLHDAL